MPARLLIIFFFALLLFACRKETEHANAPVVQAETASQMAPAPAIPLKAPPFLTAPIETEIIETLNEALPHWRKHAPHRPLLAIVAQTPGMAPVPEEKLAEARSLLKEGDDGSLKLRSGLLDPNPILVPAISVSAALDAGWFSGVVWIFPTTTAPDKLDPEVFRQQVVAAGYATPEEAEKFSFAAGVFRGTVRGRTFIAAPLKALPAVNEPMLLHIDSDYFKNIYKGEIKTPLYPLLIETLNTIKNAGWKVAAATVARSNLGADLPLQTRFLAGQIADILTEPEMLDRPIPDNWVERANALYLENFMQKDKMREIYESLEKEDPADPSLKYALYHLARQFNKGDLALEYLHQAVQIDPGYALEYVTLSDLALQKKKPEQAVKMLKLARTARPNDPHLALLLVRTMINTGDRTDAASVAAELRTLDWSELYYPEQKNATEELARLLVGPG